MNKEIYLRKRSNPNTLILYVVYDAINIDNIINKYLYCAISYTIVLKIIKQI